MTTSRTLHPACCLRCQGTGVTIRIAADPPPRKPGDFSALPVSVGMRAEEVPCDHIQRTDVTGLDDDTERILALEAEVRRLHDRESEGNRRWVELVDELRTEAERNRDLERRLSELAAEAERQADAAFNEGVEGAAKVADDRAEVMFGPCPEEQHRSAEAATIADRIRSLKRGVKPGV